MKSVTFKIKVFHYHSRADIHLARVYWVCVKNSIYSVNHILSAHFHLQVYEDPQPTGVWNPLTDVQT